MGSHIRDGSKAIYGPVHNRSCTDIVWLILFLAFLGVWGFVGYFSVTKGNVQYLLAPTDSNGKHCGVDPGFEHKKYLVYFDLPYCLLLEQFFFGCPTTTQVCEEKCPNEFTIFSKLKQQQFEELKSKIVCTKSVNITTVTFNQMDNLIENQKCARYVLPSQPVLGRCLPNVTFVMNNFKQLAKSTNQTQEALKLLCDSVRKIELMASSILDELVQLRWFMAGALAAIVVLCFIYFLLLRWVIAPVIWTSITGLFVLLSFSLYLCFKQYQYYRENPEISNQSNGLIDILQSRFRNSNTWLGILCTVALITAILLIMVIFLRSRIVIAIALIQEGSKAVTAIKSTMVFPVIPWILQCAILAYSVVIAACIYNLGAPLQIQNRENDTECYCSNPKYNKDYAPCDPISFRKDCYNKPSGIGSPCKIATCSFSSFDNPTNVVYLHVANLFGFFWARFFVSGAADMMLASTFTTWYWTFNKKDLRFFALTGGIYRVVRYHLGTVAFGSLILAIIAVIRIILEYIDRKLKKYNNWIVRCISCCCKCCFWCLEKIVKFINKNAYIMCAIRGKNFCSSARAAFSLLMRNIVRVVVLDKVMDFVFFLSKLLLTLGVGTAVYYVLKWSYVSDVIQSEQLQYVYIPAAILAIATYIISSIFFNIYAMAVDTIFLCFLEDSEKNDGSVEKPYFMTKNLMMILGKRNKLEKID